MFISLFDLSLLVYLNERSCCVLILYPATLLNSLMISSTFLIASLWFSMYNTMSSANSNTSHIFQFGFLFFLWLSWLGLPKLCLIKVVRLDFLSCSWSWRKCFQHFTIEYNVTCRFDIYVLYYVEVFSLYVHFLGSFYQK